MRLTRFSNSIGAGYNKYNANPLFCADVLQRGNACVYSLQSTHHCKQRRTERFKRGDFFFFFFNN